MRCLDKNNKSLTFIDLFAGCGGLSEGFVSCGFKPIAHVEMNLHACETLKTRACFYWLKEHNMIHVYNKYLEGSISRYVLYRAVPQEILASVICEEMSNESMPDIFEKIDRSMMITGTDHVDLIIGGPPCQAYSLVGRGRKDMSNDPRNHLYQQYIQVLHHYRPLMFVFENVPGLLTAGNGGYLQKIQAAFESAGYMLGVHKQNAADYGVLQHRERLIIVGWRKEYDLHYPEMQKHTTSATVFDLLKDLPALQPGESKNQYISEEIPDYLKKEGLRTKSDLLTWHIARPHIERDRTIYRIAIQKWLKKKERLRYTELPDELQTHRNKSAFLDRFKVVERDDTTCHTMVAHISKDGHYYIHPDINQARSLSVREAARIQSFPDNYFFEGPRTAAFMQIGNAVPPLLAKAIAEAIQRELKKEYNHGKDDGAVLPDNTRRSEPTV